MLYARLSTPSGRTEKPLWEKQSFPLLPSIPKLEGLLQKGAEALFSHSSGWLLPVHRSVSQRSIFINVTILFLRLQGTWEITNSPPPGTNKTILEKSLFFAQKTHLHERTINLLDIQICYKKNHIWIIISIMK
ncbi:unnamed protein product [Blepharisma stoltei]|uniref:Uncharacterized protein n=1 Tax=Blepharisma stoltei TaxID=1481888 RepID=A0AAU9JQY6_9CILI|nr:unnamed protein product [Blepharisma stoltei]